MSIISKITEKAGVAAVAIKEGVMKAVEFIGRKVGPLLPASKAGKVAVAVATVASITLACYGIYRLTRPKPALGPWIDGLGKAPKKDEEKKSEKPADDEDRAEDPVLDAIPTIEDDNL